MRRAACCFAAAIKLSWGVMLPLELARESEGVVDPERAGVPVTGRRFEMMPVAVRLISTAGVWPSSLS